MDHDAWGAGTNWRSVHTASAVALADAAAELHDVRFAHSAVAALLASWDEHAPTGPDTDEARALWTAAVISYARCFGEGVRRGTARHVLDQLKGLDRTNHEWAMAMRDKHLAHSVNRFEHSEVGADIGPAPDYTVLNVAPFELFTVLPDRAAAVRFQEHTWRVHLLQVSTVMDLVDVVKAELQALKPEARAALPELELTAAPPDADLLARRPRSWGLPAGDQ